MMSAFVCTGGALHGTSWIPSHGRAQLCGSRRQVVAAPVTAVLTRRLVQVPVQCDEPLLFSRTKQVACPPSAAQVVVRTAKSAVNALATVAAAIKKFRTNRNVRVARAGMSLVLAAVGFAASRGALGRMLATTSATATAAPISAGAGPLGGFFAKLASVLPEGARVIVRPFSEAFGVVFLSEFGDKSMFATALMAMKHSPFLVLLGALVALTAMTLIACFLGQLMQMLPAKVTHYSSIALFVFFGLQMIWQSRNLPDTPGGKGGERADAEELVGGEDMPTTDRLGILAKISSLIFVAEWCDRSMLATMALAASSNTAAVIGGATAANVLCTGLAVGAAALVSSRISERMVALVAGILFEVFAVFTFFEGVDEN